MKFGEALEAVKAGKRIRRQGWNGKNQYIELAQRISYLNPDGLFLYPNHAAMGNNALAFVGTSGIQVGWLASQADMLAEDWMEVDPAEIRKPKDFDEDIKRFRKNKSQKEKLEHAFRDFPFVTPAKVMEIVIEVLQNLEEDEDGCCDQCKEAPGKGKESL